jgi:hypothetical protein
MNYYWIFGAFLLLSCTKQNSEQSIDIKTLKNGQDLAEIISSPLDDNDELDTTQVAKMVFEEMVYFFGEVEEGEIVEKTFYFVNEGVKPLSIKDARTTCGCTVPSYPESLINPGDKDSIYVRFDTKNKEGYQNKTVTIIANTYPNKTIVSLKGKVNPKG